MRRVGKNRNLKPLRGCRGYFHDGSKVFDRLGREVPVVGGKVKVLVDFKWCEVDLAKHNPKSKTKAKPKNAKVSEEK